MNLHEFLIVCPLVFLAGFVDLITGIYVRRDSGTPCDCDK